ncbi:PepSY domain-containing protein [Streptomyces sp.]|uniref:PepSY domain-containing protein n=1 Tax=Streptomyces sp. TaxID=1931 RepID=UPI002812089F|nr:PepSY domain-containing protein [Streptomyces sp.]
MKRNIVIAVVTAAALVGGGTATALAVSGDDAPTTRATETRGADDDTARDDDRGREDTDDADDRDDRDGDDDARAAASSGVTAADAIAAALKHTPGTAVSAELDDEDDDGGQAAWEVDVLAGGGTWHSVRVDPATGKVLGSHTEDEDDTAQVRAALKGTSVTAGEAAKAAAAEGTVVSVDLDDDGDKGWEAETRASGEDERDWRVDLNSGKVTADRSDDADDSDSDDD